MQQKNDTFFVNYSTLQRLFLYTPHLPLNADSIEIMMSQIQRKSSSFVQSSLQKFSHTLVR